MSGQKSSSDAFDRIVAKVKIDPKSGCWNWCGTKNNKGYGKLWFSGRKQYAHRVSYLERNGSLPAGANVCHRCDNPACVNPDHLFLGSQAENIADMMSKGRQRRYDRRGDKNSNSKLTISDVIAIRSSREKLRVLSARYGVTMTQISFVRRGKTWGHITP